MSSSTWLITGASSGLGYALAEHVLKQGDRVVLAAQNVTSMAALAASYPETILAVELDVSDPSRGLCGCGRLKTDLARSGAPSLTTASEDAFQRIPHLAMSAVPSRRAAASKPTPVTSSAADTSRDRLGDARDDQRLDQH